MLLLVIILKAAHVFERDSSLLIQKTVLVSGLCKRKRKEKKGMNAREQYFRCTCQLIGCSWERLCSSQTWRTIWKIKTRLFSLEEASRLVLKMICVVTSLQYLELFFAPSVPHFVSFEKRYFNRNFEKIIFQSLFELLMKERKCGHHWKLKTNL